MSTIEEEVAKLRKLANDKPSPAKLKMVEHSLSTKWEGVESVALKVLFAWGGKDAVRLARASLERHWSDKSGWAIRAQAIKVLTKHITARDTAWVGELEQKAKSTPLMLHELRYLTARAQEFAGNLD
ncbi:MAG: hypothetical protein AAFR64_09805 [Pseudomonadota bacterium]